MKITFDCPDKINGLLTMTIEPAWLPSRYGAHGNDQETVWYRRES